MEYRFSDLQVFLIPSDIYSIVHPRGNSDIHVQFQLSTTNFANCTSPATSKSIVAPTQINSTASFTATPVTQSLPGSIVTITNTSVGTGTYKWDFGDGTSSASTSASFTHSYATYGTYIISLSITNGVCIKNQATTVTITAIPPVVDFSYDPPSGCVPLTVTFTNLSKYADATSYAWDFGDGEIISSR